MNKNFVFLVVCLIFTEILFCQRINVFDSLLSHHLFSHVELERKEDYYLKKDKTLERKVYLSSEVLHYHKSHEDSMYEFLKKAYGKDFQGLTFIAGETVEWKTESGQKFGWKKGEKLSKIKLDKVYSTLKEIKSSPYRPNFLQGEEQNHFFFYHNYLLDSVRKKIYCYNSLNGSPDGKIDFNENGQILKETGFYENGKTLYDFDGQTLKVFGASGNQMFTCNEKSIVGLDSKNGIIWEYDKAKTAFTVKGTIKNINEYYRELNYLWKENMKE